MNFRIYASTGQHLFRLDWQTGATREIRPPSRAIYGMSASPDGRYIALLLAQGNSLGSTADLHILDAADAAGSAVYEHTEAAEIPKSDGFMAHVEIAWLDDRTVGFDTWITVEENLSRVWKRSFRTLRFPDGSIEDVLMQENERKRFYAPDASRYAVQLQETREVRLISSDGERSLGYGLLLGWLDDHTLVWYENKENKLIDELFF